MVVETGNYQPCQIPWEALSSRMITDTVNKITRVDTILSIFYLRSNMAFSPRIKTLGRKRSSFRCVFSGLPTHPDSPFFACGHWSQYSVFFLPRSPWRTQSSFLYVSPRPLRSPRWDDLHLPLCSRQLFREYGIVGMEGLSFIKPSIPALDRSYPCQKW